ncbi:MAG: hypothetical protein HY763_06570 [Planctomycetes bacterium]|nr:hypothetical protein [Planctomycetota bacterium]
MVLSGSCGRDVRLTGETLRDVTVHTVSHYGVTLDEQAAPEQVAFVLLRAIRDDFLATSEAQREEAVARLYDVAAADAIGGLGGKGLTRLETLYQVIHQWTPTVAYYARDLEEDWEKARPRLLRTRSQTTKSGKAEAEEVQVLTELADPTADANARVVLVMGMVRERNHWRVKALAFAPSRRSIRAQPAVESEPRT